MASTVTAALWFGQAGNRDKHDRLPHPPVPSIFEEYFFAKSQRSSPAVALLATGSGDSDHEVASFYRRMSRLDCHPSDLSVTRYSYPNLDKLIRQQDIFYVTGGSAPKLLATWRSIGIEKTIEGMVLGGAHLFAKEEGASSLFEAYDSHAHGSVDIFQDGLGILKGTLIRHLPKDGLENYRLPNPVYIVEPSVAIEFRGDSGPYIVPTGNDGHAWRIRSQESQSQVADLPVGLV